MHKLQPYVQVDQVNGGGHMDFGVNTDSVSC